MMRARPLSTVLTMAAAAALWATTPAAAQTPAGPTPPALTCANPTGCPTPPVGAPGELATAYQHAATDAAGLATAATRITTNRQRTPPGRFKGR